MNKTELLHILEQTVPPLQGKLHVEKVLYKKEANKAYMSFLSDVLVGEREFLHLEKKLRELFPKLTVALRVASPSLGEDFLSDVNKYKSVLTDFLRRQSPATSAWINDTGWEIENGRIHLTCPEHIMALFGMTPYAWKTPKEGVERLRGYDALDTQIGFDVHIYKKI